MNLPFSVEQFFDVFARYHAAVWPMPVVLNALALLVVALLFVDSAASGRAIAAVLAGLWAWMALAYHLAFFTAVNPAAWLFGALSLVESAWLGLVGIRRGELRFAPRLDGRGVSGVVLIVFALVLYPLLGHALGHRYPAAPTFGLPCPTTIFTIGVLLLQQPPPRRSLLAVPILWSAIGSMAAFQLGVVQDLGLLLAGMIALTAVLARPASASRSRVVM